DAEALAEAGQHLVLFAAERAARDDLAHGGPRGDDLDLLRLHDRAGVVDQLLADAVDVGAVVVDGAGAAGGGVTLGLEELVADATSARQLEPRRERRRAGRALPRKPGEAERRHLDQHLGGRAVDLPGLDHAVLLDRERAGSTLDLQ